MAAFRLPPGLQVELFAAEPQLGSPVAICLDERNRLYVAEEYRFNRGTEENRTRPFLLDDDLQIRTLDDRLAMFRKFADRFEGGLDWFSKYSDQVRFLADTDGDGRADVSKMFAGGFNGTLDGLAAGVIARDGDIYLTCIPHLWRLRDNDGDGQADSREPVLSGFGVNAGFLGHDLHGLVWGPDGKLYFSVGDRGFHVTTREGAVLSGPRTGAVFCCYSDGSEFEVVARGLRNPQELAFDQFGNLFAADNNCDKGDHSRLVYVLEGGDSGWNMAYQTIPPPYLTGPWHAEQMWHLPHAGQPAWIVPPVGPLGAGPSGFTYYPGTGLPERYQGHFFLCNYTGDGGLEAFALQPRGAGFEIVDAHDFLKPIMATDAEFGYDGKLYVSDFVRLDWSGASGGGRIYSVSAPEAGKAGVVRQVEELFDDGFAQRSDGELAELLGHADMRVRLRAQFALAERGAAAIDMLQRLAAGSDFLLARLHALWGLGQIGRHAPQALDGVTALLDDPDDEVRAQSVRVLGQCRRQDAAAAIIARLTDGSLRVRLHAALALARLGDRTAAEPVAGMLRENADQDLYLRHAGVMALLASADADAVHALAKDPSPAVRMAALLVERRTQDPRIVEFLTDAEPALATEAARAINDVPIESGQDALAGLAQRFAAAPTDGLEPLLRRVINANFRLGGRENVAAVTQMAVNPHHPVAIREEALAALADWAEPTPRDRVNGFWRPLPPRDSAVVRRAIEDHVSEILASTAGDLQAKAVELIARYDVEADDGQFAAWVLDPQKAPATRMAALRLLAARQYSRLAETIAAAIQDEDPRLRAAARSVLSQIDPPAALVALCGVLQDSAAAMVERQQALATLAALKSPPADAELQRWCNLLAKGDVPFELQLDVVEAATQRDTPDFKQFVQEFEARLSAKAKDPLAKFRRALLGGNAERGRELFVGHRVAQCIRCHRIGGEGGTAGPELTHVAARNGREHLLESLVLPDAKIAQGFGSVVLALQDGTLVSGTLKSEEGAVLTIETAEGKLVAVPVEEVEERTLPKSAMSPMNKALTPRELRDVVEYLSTLR